MKRKMEDGDVGDDGGADRLHKVMVMAMMATSSTPNPTRLSYQESKHSLNCNHLILRTLIQGTSTWLKPIHANTSELSKLTLGCERPQTMQILNGWYPFGSLF